MRQANSYSAGASGAYGRFSSGTPNELGGDTKFTQFGAKRHSADWRSSEANSLYLPPIQGAKDAARRQGVGYESSSS